LIANTEDGRYLLTLTDGQEPDPSAQHRGTDGDSTYD